MNKILNEELNKMKFLFGYEKGKVISEQAQTPTQLTPKDLIIKIQTVLRDKYKQNLGPRGVDGVWGNYTQTALENVMKTISTNTITGQKDLSGLFDKLKNTQQSGTTNTTTGATTPQQTITTATTTPQQTVTTGTVTPQQATVQATAQTGTPGDETSIAASQGQLTPKQIRQKARYDAGLARQERRNKRRAERLNQRQSRTTDGEDISEL